MVDLEKQINEAAVSSITPRTDDISAFCVSYFIQGAKSDAAKAYHTKGMYSEEEVICLLGEHLNVNLDWVIQSIDDPKWGRQNKPNFTEWFEQNKKK